MTDYYTYFKIFSGKEDCHPTIIACDYLHYDRTEESYRNLADFIHQKMKSAAAVFQVIEDIDIVVGSDAERALVNG